MGQLAAPMNAPARRNHLLPLVALLVVFAWLALWLWGHSPYERYLNHGLWTEYGIALDLCRAIPGGAVVVPAFLYVGGWLLMTTAMMLPSTIPLLEVFRRLTAPRPDQVALFSLVIAGYLLIWGIFGLVAHGASWIILDAIRGNVWLTFNAWVPGAVVIFLAGAFQFSALKYRCLDKCRSPRMFVMQHWRGRSERWRSFLLGAHHGAFCVGCCWALMLLMFAVGSGSVGWMLALGAVMAVEKIVAWGRRMSAPLGVLLLGWSGLTVLAHV